MYISKDKDINGIRSLIQYRLKHDSPENAAGCYSSYEKMQPDRALRINIATALSRFMIHMSFIDTLHYPRSTLKALLT